MQSHLRNKRKEPAFPLSFPTPPWIGKLIIDGVASPEGYIRFLKTGKAAAQPYLFTTSTDADVVPSSWKK